MTQTQPRIVPLGVRHHGPGSARAVAAALEELRPAIVLVEGPPEADPLLRFAADPAMRPPVALLVHAADDPAQAGFWPYAEFSPEWAALRHAAAHGLPAAFIDLPAGSVFALDRARGAAPGTPPPLDPIAALADAAGHGDAERWWEDTVEHRLRHSGPGALDVFAALAEAMAEVRLAATHEPSDVEAAREAHMRLAIRAARRDGHRTIAVVCGAWHVPALALDRPAAADRAVLAPFSRTGRYPRVRAEATWVPWTYRRLAHVSGYGAGVSSPGWYDHLHTAAALPPAELLPRWFTRVSHLLRDAGHPVSPAHVIESVRHAEALAVLRGRPSAGLDETLEAVRAVMCDGDETRVGLVHDAIVVGERIGTVPPGVPAVPLQRDLEREQRRLRLAPEAAERILELDLRRPVDAARARLLARLDLLDVPWGTPAEPRRGTGTFREAWRLLWQPELAIRTAEAGVWGTTVEAAATARAVDLAQCAGTPADVTAVAECCLRADLTSALPAVLAALRERAALAPDVAQLAEALPGLARALRYGDVRGTSVDALAAVVEGVLARVCVGFVPACVGLDADGARAMRRHLDETDEAVRLLTRRQGGVETTWRDVLHALAAREDLHGLLTGRAARLLVDRDALTPAEAVPRLARVLTPGTPYRAAAAWIEGFLSGGGLLLVHDDTLLDLVDTWIAAIPAQRFTDVLPLLRRTFATFAPPERRTLGERLRAPGSRRARPDGDADDAATDERRADAVLPLVGFLLGGDRSAR